MDGRQMDPEPAPLHTLTVKQRQILDSIDQVQTATGEPVSARYLARRHNVAPTTMGEQLATLYRRGWLRTPGGPVTLTRRPRE